MERRSFLGRFGVGTAGLLLAPAARAAAAPADPLRLAVLRTFVAGFQHHAGMLPALAATLHAGQALGLRAEPDNPYDPDAVAVTVGEMAARIGYLPRRENTVLAALVRGGALVTAEVTAFDPAAPPWERLELAVFVEAAPAPVVAEPFAWQPTGLVVPATAMPTERASASGLSSSHAAHAVPTHPASDQRPPVRSAPLRRGLDGLLDDVHETADRLERRVRAAARRVEEAVDVADASGATARETARIAVETVEGRVVRVERRTWGLLRTVERQATGRSAQADAVATAVLDMLG